jgi:hypothetical protein
MLNELAPRPLKLSFSEYAMLSIAVKMPTNAMIPNAMMSKVSTARSRLARMFWKAMSRISEKGIGYLVC